MIENKLVDILNKGYLTILPTDTVYGIHADATNVNAIKRIDEVKKSNKPHLILVSSIEMLNEYILEIDDLQKKLINRYWPGPLTILFKKNNKISDELTKNSEYVAIRMPNDEFLLKLINLLNKPLVSTSANITGIDSITNISQISKELKDEISYIYDIGDIDNEASTLIKVKGNKIYFLRDGKLSSIIKENFKEYI